MIFIYKRLLCFDTINQKGGPVDNEIDKIYGGPNFSAQMIPKNQKIDPKISSSGHFSNTILVFFWNSRHFRGRWKKAQVNLPIHRLLSIQTSMSSAQPPTIPELPVITSQEEPRTPTIPRVAPRRVHPTSDPPQASPILRHTFN